MSVGFGFSAGDFIAALQLVSTVIDALRDSGDSSNEYRALVSQLFTLETALLKVKRLEVDDEQHAEVIALRQAACQCQTTIDEFWEKIKKYQPSLREGGSGSRVKDGWRKIRWALCKKDDLVKFKADLVGHTESIELLLMTLHMGSTRIEGKRQEENYKTLAGKMQEGYFGCMQKLSSIMDCVSIGVEQGKKILEMTAKVIQTNLDVFHIVLNIQSIITRIPGQVERQQPVYFIDALGRHTPFNLEFILSAEALTHVLSSNFRNIGSGSQKIERGEFAIQDTGLKSDIDLTGPWESCFRPGQRVDMSMVFVSKKNPSQSCPACQQDNGDGFEEDQDVECKKCGVTFRRTVTRVFESKKTPEIPVMVSHPSARDLSSLILNHGRGELKRKRESDEDEEMALFRRVRVKTSVVLPSKTSRSSSPTTGETAGDFLDNFYELFNTSDANGLNPRGRVPSIKTSKTDSRQAEVIPRESLAHPKNNTTETLRAPTEFLPTNASSSEGLLSLVSNKRPRRRKTMDALNQAQTWTSTVNEDVTGKLYAEDGVRKHDASRDKDRDGHKDGDRGELENWKQAEATEREREAREYIAAIPGMWSERNVDDASKAGSPVSVRKQDASRDKDRDGHKDRDRTSRAKRRSRTPTARRTSRIERSTSPVNIDRYVPGASKRRESIGPNDGEEVDKTIPPSQDRWSQIRKDATRRAAERQSEEQSGRGSSYCDDDGETSGEEARIKARVAELIGNAGHPNMKPDSESDRMRKRKTAPIHEETTAPKRHQASSINDARFPFPDPLVQAAALAAAPSSSSVSSSGTKPEESEQEAKEKNEATIEFGNVAKQDTVPDMDGSQPPRVLTEQDEVHNAISAHTPPDSDTHTNFDANDDLKQDFHMNPNPTDLNTTRFDNPPMDLNIRDFINFDTGNKMVFDDGWHKESDGIIMDIGIDWVDQNRNWSRMGTPILEGDIFGNVNASTSNEVNARA
ncbi:uncharacterized protein PAC_17982 [Phialocephala subalpina]|uniref:Uncharacterized protein n=1 Tax=Phialocephala subalpina TaxID=576137 RepID=A0A1L7XSS7_9HELO|nr:uncharacterized protein PAC_17982 [Phialocephala subalpina]